MGSNPGYLLKSFLLQIHKYVINYDIGQKEATEELDLDLEDLAATKKGGKKKPQRKPIKPSGDTPKGLDGVPKNGNGYDMQQQQYLQSNPQQNQFQSQMYQQQQPGQPPFNFQQQLYQHPVSCSKHIYLRT